MADYSIPLRLLRLTHKENEYLFKSKLLGDTAMVFSGGDGKDKNDSGKNNK